MKILKKKTQPKNGKVFNFVFYFKVINIFKFIKINQINVFKEEDVAFY